MLDVETDEAPKRSFTPPSSGDVVAGVSVALVAIPQSLAYTELAGMPAQYGLFATALPTPSAIRRPRGGRQSGSPLSPPSLLLAAGEYTGCFPASWSRLPSPSR